MEKIQYSDIDFNIKLMTSEDFKLLSTFSCGVKTLDDFFKYEIEKCVNMHYLSAYCAITRDFRIVGAFTLMNDALMIGGYDEKTDFIEDLRFESQEEVFEFFKRQTSYPSINIGHLGILTDYQNKGIGTSIVDFVADTFSKYKFAGCQFVTVDALNNRDTINFYLQSGFSFQTNKDFYSATRRMYRIL